MKKFDGVIWLVVSALVGNGTVKFVLRACFACTCRDVDVDAPATERQSGSTAAALRRRGWVRV